MESYPSMIKMKRHMADLGIKRLGSRDCGVKKLPAVGETRWVNYGRAVNIRAFCEQAKGALEWLDEHCQGAWRYGAQQRFVESTDDQMHRSKMVELRHKVQFENASDAILFKLSYRP